MGRVLVLPAEDGAVDDRVAGSVELDHERVAETVVVRRAAERRAREVVGRGCVADGGGVSGDVCVSVGVDGNIPRNVLLVAAEIGRVDGTGAGRVELGDHSVEVVREVGREEMGGVVRACRRRVVVRVRASGHVGIAVGVDRDPVKLVVVTRPAEVGRIAQHERVDYERTGAVVGAEVEADIAAVDREARVDRVAGAVGVRLVGDRCGLADRPAGIADDQRSGLRRPAAARRRSRPRSAMGRRGARGGSRTRGCRWCRGSPSRHPGRRPGSGPAGRSGRPSATLRSRRRGGR